VRAVAEPLLGQDFSRVRVHSDEGAASAAAAERAVAYAIGDDIVLGRGRGRTDTAGGQALLVHELAHVAQQRMAGTSAERRGEPDAVHEREADRAAHALTWGSRHHRYGDVAADVAWTGSRRPALAAVLTPSNAALQRVQLTYDDGPDSAGNTRRVLSALNAAGARATFYLVGKKVAQGDGWRTTFDIAAAGHWLGNHAYDWDDARDNHVFLNGTVEQRANKILQTEWAIRDALITGKADAQARNVWDSIPAPARAYIDDVIAHGTGRFRTPGFRSHNWTSEGTRTRAGLASVNTVLAASGLRPLRITELGTLTHEGVDVDPEDWRQGRTQSEIESSVKSDLDENRDSILLHSRVASTAAATPAIVADIGKRGYSYDPTVQGALHSMRPRAGFAGLSRISTPPTSAEIATAKAFFRRNVPGWGPVLCGSLALGILQLAQEAGTAEVDTFVREIRTTTVGGVPLANWLNGSEDWRIFAGFFENWATRRPFPKIRGVTI
jgi:peptidoglycan/xylan/chitin deacetylase (PgdA/CDA1 family)